jgi:hypothetical protein
MMPGRRLYFTLFSLGAEMRKTQANTSG